MITKKPCPECQGTGNCRWCINGKNAEGGKCKMCKGLGDCPACGGSGYKK